MPVKMSRKIVAAALLVAGGVGAVAAPVAASHPHHLETPGACVDRSGQGFGTGQSHADNTADPGDTTFHERIHKGTPGLFAFEQEGNPVAVAGGLCEDAG